MASAAYAATSRAAWAPGASGLGAETTPALDVAGLARKLRDGEVTVLDVRSAAEWKAGHVEGSIHVPYQNLRNGVPDEVSNAGDKPLAVICGSGVRSTLAASLLKRSGVENVEHVADGGVPNLAGEGIELVEGDRGPK